VHALSDEEEDRRNWDFINSWREREAERRQRVKLFDELTALKTFTNNNAVHQKLMILAVLLYMFVVVIIFF